jgi:hypothetical protein
MGPFGEIEGGLFTGGFEKRMKEVSGRGASLHGSAVRGTGMEGSYNQDSERHDMEDSGNGAFFLRAP